MTPSPSGQAADRMNEPAFLFAHGAGAGSAHPWMERWAERLEALGRVRRFDYPYMRERRSRPDPLPALVAAHLAALQAWEEESGGPMVLIGKSMGSRVGCHVAVKAPERVRAVICLGYPLCGAGDRAKLRDAVLKELKTPILFIQGTRDALCPLDLLAETRAQMQAANSLHVVEEGDHSLEVSKRWLKKNGKAQEEIDAEILQAIASFLTAQRI